MFKKESEINKHISVRDNGMKDEISVIGKTMKLKGNISADEQILIEGTVEGSIKMKHDVIVGRSGKVNADITAREIIIKGEVNGNVYGDIKVEIVPGGVLNGDIVSENVVLAEGAKFKGSIDMTVRRDDSDRKPKIEKQPFKDDKNSEES